MLLNIEHLTVSCLPYKGETEFPLSLFNSQSLEHLTIAGHSCVSSVILTSTWEGAHKLNTIATITVIN